LKEFFEILKQNRNLVSINEYNKVFLSIGAMARYKKMKIIQNLA